MRSRATSVMWGCAAAMALLVAAPVPAQTPKDDPGAGQPNPQVPRKTKPARKSVVDLQQQAQERRPGQVLPGDPAPFGTKPAAAEPAPAPANGSRPPAVGLPDTGTVTRPSLRPSADGSTRLQTEPAAEVPLVDRSVLSAVPMPVSIGDAKIRVESAPGDSGTQWRSVGQAWTTPHAGDSLQGRIEIRVGLDTDLVVVVDERVQVRIPRLGHAVIESCVEPGGQTSVSVSLSRGVVEIRPVAVSGSAGAPAMFARVRTPDENFGVVGPLRVEYDAFTGTRRRVVNP